MLKFISILSYVYTYTFLDLSICCHLLKVKLQSFAVLFGCNLFWCVMQGRYLLPNRNNQVHQYHILNHFPSDYKRYCVSRLFFPFLPLVYIWNKYHHVLTIKATELCLGIGQNEFSFTFLRFYLEWHNLQISRGKLIFMILYLLFINTSIFSYNWILYGSLNFFH